MDVRAALKGQYHASLKTLRVAIEKCPEPMWNNPADGAATFWRASYHTLFYAHFYLQQDKDAFTPWPRHREGAQRLSGVTCEPVSRQMMLEYWDFCDSVIDAGIDRLDLDAPQCGFPWYKMPTLDHQIVNIRHIQNHAAALASRLRREAKIDVDWIGCD